MKDQIQISPPPRGGVRGGVVGAILITIFLFLLPWQTRWIFEIGKLNGGVWEYGTLSIYATEILLWLIALIIMARRQLPITNYQLPITFFIAYLFLSSLWSTIPRVTLFSAVHLVSAILLLLFITRYSFSRPRKMVTPTAAFIAGSLLQAILGLVQFATQKIGVSTLLGISSHLPSALGASVIETADGRLLRAYGGLPHPNILGGYLAMALLLTIDLLFRASKKTERILLSGVSLILAAGLLVTFSRSAWLGFFIGLILFFYRDCISVPRCNLGGVIHKGRIIAPILIAVAIFVFIGKDVLAPRLMGETRLEEISRTERVSGIKESLAVIRSSPWLGVGIGNYTAALANLAPGRPSWSYQPVHNVPLLILAELGLLGFVLLLYGLKKLRVTSYELRVTNPIILALIIIALFDHYLWSLYPGLLLVVITIGLSLRSPALRSHEVGT